MDETARDKLVKVLRMFSSDHDGEVASAARRAHSIVKTLALDWDDLIIRAGARKQHRSSAPPPPQDDIDIVLIKECLEVPQHLTAWENDFLSSIRQSILEWGRLTPKQKAVLDRIVNKLRLNGHWPSDF